MARDTMYSIGHQLSDKSVVALKTPPHAGFGPDGPRFWSRRCQKHRECPAFGRPVSQTSPRIRKKELKTLRGAGPALPNLMNPTETKSKVGPPAEANDLCIR